MASHIRKRLGGIPLDQLTREDVATWIDGMAAGGVYARRSIQVFRMVLRAALDEAEAEGRLRPRNASPPAGTWVDNDLVARASTGGDLNGPFERQHAQDPGYLGLLVN